MLIRDGKSSKNATKAAAAAVMLVVVVVVVAAASVGTAAAAAAEAEEEAEEEEEEEEDKRMPDHGKLPAASHPTHCPRRLYPVGAAALNKRRSKGAGRDR